MAQTYQHIYSPTKGIVTNIIPTALTKESSPSIDGMYLSNGEVVSDYGYVNYPEPSTTQTNKLHGVFMKGMQFYKSDGSTYPVVVTTTNAYLYNTSTGTWDVITQGQLLSNCETAWTAGSADVTVSNSTTVKLRGSKSVKLSIVAQGDIILNGNFETWSGGASVAPDNWVLT